jgi:hypothetical protein
MNLPQGISTVAGILTLGAGVLPAAVGQLDKDGAIAKSLGGAAESIGKTSQSALEKIGVKMSPEGSAALLGVVATTLLGATAYLTRDKDDEPSAPRGIPGMPGGGPSQGK